MLLSHSHHGWNSFESIAEIYNESMRDSQNHNYINMVDFSRSYPITLEEGNYVLHRLYYAFSTLHTVRMCLIIHYSIYVLYTIYTYHGLECFASYISTSLRASAYISGKAQVPVYRIYLVKCHDYY